MSDIRKVPLAEISTELLPPQAIAADADGDHPLVVIEDGGQLILVDGFKRFFALKARGEEKAWVIQKAWTRAEAKLHRLRLNNPTRHTTLREELDLLDDLRSKEELSVHAIFRGLGKKKAWVEKRLSVLKTLSPDAASLIPDRLFTVTVAQGVAALPADEQVATVLSIQETKLHLAEAIRFLKLLQVHDGPDRARLRQSPRKHLEALAAGGIPAEPAGLLRVLEVFDRALEKAAGQDPRILKAHLRALIDRAQAALLGLEAPPGSTTENASSPPAATVASP